MPPDSSTIASRHGRHRTYDYRRRDAGARRSLRRRRALRLGVPAPARRRALLPHAGRRARRADPRSRLRHGPAAWCRCCATGTSSSASIARRPMLARAAARARAACRRAARAPRAAACAATCARSPLAAPRFAFAVAAFHSVQHLATDASSARFFAASRARWSRAAGWRSTPSRPTPRLPGARTRRGRGAGTRTRFRHPDDRAARPSTRRATGSTRGALLTTTFHYQPRRRARPTRAAAERHVAPRPPPARPRRGRARCWPRAGLTLIASWGGFDGRPLARRQRRPSSTSTSRASRHRRAQTRGRDAREPRRDEDSAKSRETSLKIAPSETRRGFPLTGSPPPIRWPQVFSQHFLTEGCRDGGESRKAGRLA